MKKAVINKGSSPRDVAGDLRFTESYCKKDFSLCNTTRSAEDSRHRHSGMISFFHEKAFTLIELLVVVLIIGILAAIALPQYQKAVLKARAVQVIPLVKKIATEQQVYYLANGSFAETVEDMGIEFNCPADWTCTMGGTANPKIQARYDPYNIHIIEYYGVPTNEELAAAGAQGKIYCSSNTDIGVSVCKTFGPELYGGNRYLIQ